MPTLSLPAFMAVPEFLEWLPTYLVANTVVESKREPKESTGFAKIRAIFELPASDRMFWDHQIRTRAQETMDDLLQQG